MSQPDHKRAALLNCLSGLNRFDGGQVRWMVARGSPQTARAGEGIPYV
jgi:hypothetical protein